MKQLELTRLVGEMTASMLGVNVTETATPPDADGQQVIGCVQLQSDGWSGSILVSLPSAAAVNATAAMFMLEGDEVDDELVADAVGEFANVLAGMIKTEIGGGCSLSLPTVTSGAGVRLSVPGAQPVDERRYSSDLGELSVTTMETQ